MTQRSTWGGLVETGSSAVGLNHFEYLCILLQSCCACMWQKENFHSDNPSIYYVSVFVFDCTLNTGWQSYCLFVCFCKILVLGTKLILFSVLIYLLFLSRNSSSDGFLSVFLFGRNLGLGLGLLLVSWGNSLVLMK